MTALSSAAWVVHDVGLATSIGGTLFGRAALQPSLDEIERPAERDLVSADAWRRFSWVNLASHLAFAVPWVVGRTLRNGREVGKGGRALTRAKDMLIGVSLVTGIGSIVVGRILGRRSQQGRGPEQVREGNQEMVRSTRAMERSVGVLGTANLIANLGILGVTALLAMKAGKSVRFAGSSRWLP